MSFLLELLVGAVVGVLVGITGTGGAFVIPALIYLFRMDQLRAQGTALLISSLPTILWGAGSSLSSVAQSMPK